MNELVKIICYFFKEVFASIFKWLLSSVETKRGLYMLSFEDCQGPSRKTRETQIVYFEKIVF